MGQKQKRIRRREQQDQAEEQKRRYSGIKVKILALRFQAGGRHQNPWPLFWRAVCEMNKPQSGCCLFCEMNKPQSGCCLFCEMIFFFKHKVEIKTGRFHTLSIHVSVCLPACLQDSACLPVCLPACLSACLSVCLYASVCISISPRYRPTHPVAEHDLGGVGRSGSRSRQPEQRLRSRRPLLSGRRGRHTHPESLEVV